MKPPKGRVPKERIQGQASWRLENDAVTAFLTETGGHLGPVTFRCGEHVIEPFSVAPWAEEKLPPEIPPLLRALRGDFFCLPFGGNETPYRGEQHPPHGETANAKWILHGIQQQTDATILHASLKTTVRAGIVDKFITLRDQQTALYCEHCVSGMAGPMSLGHHAMLKFPDSPNSGLISTSPFVRGQVFVEPVERPEARGYSILKPGAEFSSLDDVPTITGERADLSRYPARRGFEDIVQLAADPSLEFAWTAVAFPKQRFVWFALKNPRVLRQTVFWISNGGRHYPPWNGRHVNVMGLEEVTSYFHLGLAESARRNPLAASGNPTVENLKPGHPLSVRYIMAVAPIPGGFDHVADIEAAGDNAVLMRSRNGKKVRAALDWRFVI